MVYALYDFSESLHRVADFKLEDIAGVIAAWGYSPEGGGSWTGGFLIALKDGRTAYLSGWCDYTGWGCQDGVTLEWPDHADYRRIKVDDPWDEAPADLNRYVRGEIDEWGNVVGPLSKKEPSAP